MCFQPAIAKDCREMDARIFTPGVIGIREDWGRAGPT
jgi:hypothetical protein